MALQTITLNSLMPPTANPRTAINEDSLSGLAASLKQDGVLQNLVVTPVKGKGKRYRIISGERRYRALMLLAEKGEIANDYEVPVEIKTSLTKDDTARIATVENMQRENLAPLDEAKAFAKLIHGGITLDDIAAQTGLSRSTIKRRMALNNLCEDAATALAEGKITLAQAEALTIGTHDAQMRLLPNVVRGGYGTAPDQIKHALTRGKPSLAMAIFPREQYKGSYTEDLFPDEQTTYFDDGEQFFFLQEAAVNLLAAEHRQTAAWVEITGHSSIQDWLYGEAEEGEQGGVLINLAPSGEVEIKTGLIKPEIDEETAEEVADTPAAPEKKQASYSKGVCEYFAHHKTLAVQSLLLGNPRKAKEVAVLQLIGSKDLERSIKWQPHKALKSFETALDKPPAYEAIEKEADDLARKIGKITVKGNASGKPAWQVIAGYRSDDPALYKEIKKLSDGDLERLLVLLTVMPFGQTDAQALDTGETAFNAVARDLKADMRAHWTPDRAFLEKRNQKQLVQIAFESGFAEGRSYVVSFTKGELVTGLERYFKEAKDAAKPTAAQSKALNWLPEAMNFPAVDPDAEPDEPESMEEAA